MKKCVIIYNPNSGKKIKKDFLATFIDMLLEKDYIPEVIFSKYKGHITKIVEELENVDLVISVGGDGTFNESMTGNLKRANRLLLAHIPLGTTNDVGVMFGYGKDPIANLKMLLDGVEKNIDIDFDQVDLDDDSTLLLCTDGLSNYVSNEEIIELTKDKKHYAFADRLVNRANENGGGDNITAVVISK